jgi:hypothetical protein
MADRSTVCVQVRMRCSDSWRLSRDSDRCDPVRSLVVRNWSCAKLPDESKWVSTKARTRRGNSCLIADKKVGCSTEIGAIEYPAQCRKIFL